jgi:hypothetical protein
MIGALLLASLLPQDPTPTPAAGYAVARLAPGYPLNGPLVLAVDGLEGDVWLVVGVSGAAGATLLRLAHGSAQPVVVARGVGALRGIARRASRAVVLEGSALHAADSLADVDGWREVTAGLPRVTHGPVAALDGGLYVASDAAVWRVDPDDGSVRRVAGGFGSLTGLVATADGALVVHEARGLVQVLPGVEGGVVVEGGGRVADGPVVGALVSGGAWPAPDGDALFLAVPEAGEVQRVELLVRGAGLAVGSRVAVLRGDPAEFRPAAIAAAPNGDRLVVAAFGAGDEASLWSLSRPDAAPAPAPGGLEDPRMAVRLEAQAAARAGGLAMLRRLEDGLVRAARPFDPDAARRFGARERLFGTLDSDRARRHAVWALASFAHEPDADVRRRAGLLLERCVAHEAPEVREQAAYALAYWPDELIEPDRVVALLRDDAAAVRCAAGHAVAARGYRLAGRDLVAALDAGGDPALVAALRAALVELRAWDPIAECVQRLVSEPERRAALWSLFDGCRDEDAVFAVAELAGRAQVNFRMRREALEVLAHMYQRTVAGDEPWPGNAYIRRALEKGLEDEAPAVREQAAAELARIDE